jgi:two-component system CheB/CheR fusion protein
MKVYDALLQNAITSGVLINNHNELVHTFGDTSEFIRHRPGKTKLDILSMAQGDIRIALSTAISRVNKDNQPVTYKSIRISEQDQEKFIELNVEPILEKSSDPVYMLVSFKKVHGPEKKSESSGEFDLDSESQKRINDLETELKYTKENLQATVEELETSNEELQASNEELMASNEELQSTNEELHSVNEELYTVNAEYEQKIQELGEMTKDMNNLLNSTKIGTVFLDINLNIRKFTPAIAQSFNLLEQDIGRPIEHISHNIVGNTSLMEDIKKVRDTGQTIEKEVKNNRGRWFVKRILPYLDQAGRIEGVVLTFVDITGVKKAQQQLKDAKNYAQSIVDTVAESLITIDADMNIKTANRAFYKYFDLSPEQVEAKPLQDLDGGLFDDPEVVKMIKKVFTQNRFFQDFEVNASPADGQEKIFSITARRIDTHNNDSLLLLAIDDITRKRISEREIIKNEQILRSAMEASLDAFYMLSSIKDQKKQIVDFEFINLNSKARELLNIPDQQIIGRRVCEILPYHREKGLFNKYKEVINTGRAYEDEYDIESNYVNAHRIHQQAVRVGDNDLAITTRIVK